MTGTNGEGSNPEVTAHDFDAKALQRSEIPDECLHGVRFPSVENLRNAKSQDIPRDVGCREFQHASKCFALYHGDDRPWRLPELAFRGNVCEFTDSTIHWAVMVARRYRHANVFVLSEPEGDESHGRGREMAWYLEHVKRANRYEQGPREDSRRPLLDSEFSRIKLLNNSELSADHFFDVIYFNPEDLVHFPNNFQRKWLEQFFEICGSRLVESRGNQPAYGYLLISHERLFGRRAQGDPASDDTLIDLWDEVVWPLARSHRLDVTFSDVYEFTKARDDDQVEIPELIYGLKFFREGSVNVTTFLRQARHVLSERLGTHLDFRNRKEYESYRTQIDALFRALFDQFGKLLDRPELRSHDRRDAMWVRFSFPGFSGSKPIQHDYYAASTALHERYGEDQSEFEMFLEKRVRLAELWPDKKTDQEQALIYGTSELFRNINEHWNPETPFDIIEARPVLSGIAPSTSLLNYNRMLAYWVDPRNPDIRLTEGNALELATDYNGQIFFVPAFTLPSIAELERKWVRYFILHLNELQNVFDLVTRRTKSHEAPKDQEERFPSKSASHFKGSTREYFMAYYRSIRFRHNLAETYGLINILSSIDPMYNAEFERFLRQLTTVFRHVNLAFQDGVSRYHWNIARIRGAVAMIGTRNLAHNVGSHLLVGPTEWYGKGEGGKYQDIVPSADPTNSQLEAVVTNLDKNDLWRDDLIGAYWREQFQQWIAVFVRTRSELQAELASDISARHGCKVSLRELMASILHPVYLRRMMGQDQSIENALTVDLQLEGADNALIEEQIKIFGAPDTKIQNLQSEFLSEEVLVPDYSVGISAVQMIAENVMRNFAKHGDEHAPVLRIRLKWNCEEESRASRKYPESGEIDFPQLRMMIEIGCPIDIASAKKELEAIHKIGVPPQGSEVPDGNALASASISEQDAAFELAKRIQSHVYDPIVTASGEYSTQFRGMKEMRVAAAFLRSNDLIELYKPHESNAFPRFITVTAEERTICGKKRWLLMHRFFLFKPVEFLDIRRPSDRPAQALPRDEETQTPLAYNAKERTITGYPDQGVIPGSPRAEHLVWRHDVSENDCSMMMEPPADQRSAKRFEKEAKEDQEIERERRKMFESAQLMRSIWSGRVWVHRFGAKDILGTTTNDKNESCQILRNCWLDNLAKRFESRANSTEQTEILDRILRNEKQVKGAPGIAYVRHDFEVDNSIEWNKLHIEYFSSSSALQRALENRNDALPLEFAIPAAVPIIVIDERIQSEVASAHQGSRRRQLKRCGIFVPAENELELAESEGMRIGSGLAQFYEGLKGEWEGMITPIWIVHASIWTHIESSAVSYIKANSSAIVLCSGQGKQEGARSANDVELHRRMPFSTVYHYLIAQPYPSKYGLLHALQSATP